MMKLGRILASGILVFGVSACTHVAGTVIGGDGRGLKTAMLSVGRPTDIAHYGDHAVDAYGHFDFYIAPPDETNLYVWDSVGDPMATMQQIDPGLISDHMKIKVARGGEEMDPSLVPFK
jgi:hypothetical protein